MGSSPLARGPPSTLKNFVRYFGLIPARAGTTKATSGKNRFNRAHPRSRGDHIRSDRIRALWPGSSPLARGPLVTSKGATTSSGLIPARAGTTSATHDTAGICRAHPRSRGDHLRWRLPPFLSRGSSPLARGPLTLVNCRSPAIRLIPARAGTTHLADYRRGNRRAHPRSRGDHVHLP